MSQPLTTFFGSHASISGGVLSITLSDLGADSTEVTAISALASSIAADPTHNASQLMGYFLKFLDTQLKPALNDPNLGIASNTASDKGKTAISRPVYDASGNVTQIPIWEYTFTFIAREADLTDYMVSKVI
jgi:hypothetical protein